MNVRVYQIVGLAIAILVGGVACSASAGVTKTQAMMSPAEIAGAGLICRKDRPANSNIPRTICASEAAWADYDERRRQETEALMAEGRKLGNSSRYRN
jgi:hypothetical protein